MNTPVAQASAWFRMSPQQRRVWSLHAAGASSPYHAACVLELEGVLDRGALRRAVEEMAWAHEALRTVFQPLPGTRVPAQGLCDELAPAWLDVEGPVAPDALRRAAAAGLEPAHGPVFGAALADNGAGRHLLALATHALAGDAATLRALAGALPAAYAAALAGGEAPPAEVQYPTVSEVFNDLLESDETRAGREYWAEAPRVARPEAAEPVVFAPAASGAALPAELASRVRALAADEETGASAVLLAAWGVLLARTEGEVGVGVRFEGRVYEGLDTAAGAFERYLPVWLPPAESFRAAVRAADAAVAGHYAWQDYLEPAADGVAHFAFAFDAVEVPAPGDAAGMRFRVVELGGRTERCDLRLSAADDGDTLALVWEHDGSRMDAASAARMDARFRALLTDALARPDAPARSLSVLPAAERGRVLAMARGAGDAPALGDIAAAFAAQVARTPRRTAVVCGPESATFAELDAASNRLAHRLREEGVRPEVPVGLCAERSVQLVVGLLGILKAGGVLVPLDPTFPAERIAGMARLAGIGVFVTGAGVHARGLLPEGATVCLDADAGRLAALPADAPDSGLHPGNAAYVIFTSGSTGTPRGVVVSHGAALSLLAALRAAVYRDAEGARVSLNAPLVFDGSVKQWIQLLDGHTLHVIADEDRLSPARMLAWLRRERVEVLDCTPTQLRGLFAAGLGGEPEPLRTVLCGGEALDGVLWEGLRALAPVRAFNVYGPTEFTVDATAAEVGAHPAATLGRPLAGTLAYVLDAELQPMPVGVAGELCLAGERPARGYLADPARTAERFVPDPFGGPGARMYRTGDLARWSDDGTLAFAGRTDDQVKVRGVRIEPGEIEAVLRAHPAVAAAVAGVVVEGGEPQLAAWFVPAGEAEPVALSTELRERLRAHLPEFMVPAWVVPVAEVPLTASGKVDRRALPDPRAVLAGHRTAYVAPASDLEHRVAAVWADVLGVERVGLHDNFFDLGGNSLLVVQAFDGVRGMGDEGLTLVDLFRYPTVALLAGRLGAGEPETSTALSEVEERARRQREAMARQRRPAGTGR